MQKHMPRKQLNNEGFSLVELLIAIVILSIIVVPLLHSFVTSARTNAKSRSTMHATAIAEDIMEMFEAYSLEEMADIILRRPLPDLPIRQIRMTPPESGPTRFGTIPPPPAPMTR